MNIRESWVRFVNEDNLPRDIAIGCAGVFAGPSAACALTLYAINIIFSSIPAATPIGLGTVALLHGVLIVGCATACLSIMIGMLFLTKNIGRGVDRADLDF